MKIKRVLALLLAAVLLCTPAYAGGLTVCHFEETGQRLLCRGEEQSISAYNINGNNYFKLRDMASLLGAQVYRDEASQTIELVPAIYE